MGSNSRSGRSFEQAEDGPPPSSPGEQRSTRRAAGTPLPSWRWEYLVPLVVLVVVLVMTAFGISGSSEARLSPTPSAESGVLFGEARAIRSDEWLVRTPLVSGQVERGFDRVAPVGVGDHDMSVLYDLPTSDWPTLMRPQTWAYWVLPFDNAFAFEWWSLAAILVVGVYVFGLAVLRDWRWATVLALAVYFSPFFHWWYLPFTLALMGWCAGAVGCWLFALRAGPGRRSLLLSLAAGYFLACFAISLYPPFQVPAALVLGVPSVALAVSWIRSGQMSWREALVPTAVAVGIALVVTAAFVVTRSATIRAITDTAYPGRRRALGGDGDVQQLVTGWFGWTYVTDPDGMRGRVFGNESESSSFLMLGLFLVAALPLLWRDLFGRAQRLRWFTIALLAAIGLLLAHAYLGLPRLLTRVTLLDRVQPPRVVGALGVASMVLLAVVGSTLARSHLPRWRRLSAGVVLAAVSGLYVASFGTALHDSGAPVGRRAIVLAVVAAVAVAVVYVWRPLIGMSALAALGLVMCVGINPLYRGFDPLDSSQLARDVVAVEREEGDGGWLSTFQMAGPVITASGAANVAGVNVYPNADAWRILDPDGAQEEIWNRYSHTLWDLDPTATTVDMGLIAPDAIRIRIDPCSDALRQLGVRYIVASDPSQAPCFRPLRETTIPTGEAAVILERIGG